PPSLSSMWQYIPFRRCDPYVKTGLNEAVMDAVADSSFFWLAGWERPCINVGRSQRVRDEVDVERARSDGIDIVRRQGGGGTMYLTPDGELTWGLAAPADTFPDSFEAIYSECCGRVVDALDALGIEATYEPINDVVTEQGKISGATARRQDGTVYVGGTLLVDVDPDTMFTYLTPDEAKQADKETDDPAGRVTAVTDETDASFQQVQDAVRAAFLDGKTYETTTWPDTIMEQATTLAAKYRDDDWVFQHD
ncbi:MAG: biotin/lipoate A/B protein ligase family protein, partial [Candidatus Nanohaloarchaea archaeon]|nr:biotin/lipoate A/B protein ligase family protein [Candidatus Nanohaloarchaea archaeon]